MVSESTKLAIVMKANITCLRLTLVDVLADLLIRQVIDVLLWDIRFQEEVRKRSDSSQSSDHFDTFNQDLQMS
jgi:hypothetical protein